MGDFTPGVWKKCTGMNRDGKCAAPLGVHLTHKKSWGSWYGQVAVRDMPPRGKPNGPQKRRFWK